MPFSQNAVFQQILQAVVQQIPQTGVSVSLPISQTRNTIVQQIPQTEGAVGGAIGGVVGGTIGGMVGVVTGAVPRTSNPYYLPEMEYPERILSSTPTRQNVPISTMNILRQDNSNIPHLTPHVNSPPGFSYTQYEQGFIQA